MEYWKFVILTYISVALIEGIPTGNDLYDNKPVNMVKLAIYDQEDNNFDDIHSRRNPISNYFANRRSTTTVPVVTTVAPGSLADLNLKMDAMKNQLTALSNQINAEDQKIQDLATQMQDISNKLTTLQGLITGSAG